MSASASIVISFRSSADRPHPMQCPADHGVLIVHARPWVTSAEREDAIIRRLPDPKCWLNV